MTDADQLRLAFRGDADLTRRQRRARRTREQALSPGRILLRLASVPVVATGLTVSIYVSTSPLGPEDALRDLLTRTGCGMTERLGLAPAAEGEVGYHARNDPDGDGVACGDAGAADVAQAAGAGGGAKFVRP